MRDQHNYQLRQELEPAHSGDVKAVLAIDYDTIASASRDGSVGVWRRTGDKVRIEVDYRAALLNWHPVRA